MAINIPPDQSGPPKSRPSSEGRQKPATDAADRPAKTESVKDPEGKVRSESSVIKAVVTEVQAKQASGHYTKALYEATIQLNPGRQQLSSPQASQPPTVKEQIDAALSRQIQAGRSVAIRVETPAPLKVGQLLDVQLSGEGLKLVKISPPPIAMTTQPLIRQEINLQNSYVHLLAKVIAVIQSLKNPLSAQNLDSAAQTAINRSPGSAQPVQSSQPGTNASSVANSPASRPVSPQALVLQQQTARQLEQIVRQFLQSLPTQTEASDSRGLKNAVRNSGIFYESRIIQPDRFNGGQSITRTSPPTDNASQIPLPSDAGSNTRAGGQVMEAINTSNKRAELIQQIRQHIKTLKTTLQDSAPREKASATENAISNTMGRDLKYNLLQLENQLKKLQTEIQSSKASDKATTTPATEGPKNKAAPTVDPAAIKSPDGKPPEPGAKTLDKVLLDQVREKVVQQRSDRESSSPVYQRPRPTIGTSTPSVYQEDIDSQTKPKVPGLDWTHPPLPGKIHVQPQSIRPNLAPNESLADALLSVLIKHTKEATSRLNLHQLASLTDMARPETAAQQTMLSFELPILQGLDLSLFQFRIYDEETGRRSDESGDTKEKKWVVHMGFDLEGLGPMYCQITLIGMSASVTFWAEEKKTVDRSREHMDLLRGNLNKLGVNVKEMQCIKGSPPHDESGIKQTLIDIET